jgi:transposase
MTDSKWARLEPLIPGQSQRAPAHHREAIKAILYLLRTGYPWRYLPHDGFPPGSTVYNIFRNFQKDGVRDAIWRQLHMDLREDMERATSPTAAIIDIQSLKSAGKGAVMTV